MVARRGSVRGPIKAIAVVAMILLAACSSSDDGDAADPTPTSEGAEPTRGGTLRFAQLSAVASLDPTRLSAQQAAIDGGTPAFAIYGALMVVDRESEEVEPFMAESLETTDEGTTWVLKLKPDLKFSDGTPLDAEAVKFNWDRIAAEESLSKFKPVIATWTSYVVTDPLTLTITLPTPNTQFPRAIASGFSFIGSPTAITAKGEEFASSPVGAGPFVVQEFVASDHVSLVRNDTYFDAPRPYLDGLVIRFIQDDRQRINSFNADEADLIYILDSASVQELEAQGDEVVLAPSTQTSPLKMNAALAPTDDLRIRTAFWQAADIGAICAARQGAPCEDVPNGLFGKASPYFTPEGEFPEHDLDAAQELVDEYLADTGADEVSVTYSFVSGSDIATNVATVLKSNLERLDGVTITLNPVASAAYSSQSLAGSFQMSSGAFTGSSPDDQVFDFLHTGGSTNKSLGYTDPDLDAALDRTRSSLDEDEVVEAWQEVAAIVAEQVLVIPYFDPTYAFGFHDEVHGVKVFGDVGLRVDQLWMG